MCLPFIKLSTFLTFIWAACAATKQRFGRLEIFYLPTRNESKPLLTSLQLCHVNLFLTVLTIPMQTGANITLIITCSPQHGSVQICWHRSRLMSLLWTKSTLQKWVYFNWVCWQCEGEGLSPIGHVNNVGFVLCLEPSESWCLYSVSILNLNWIVHDENTDLWHTVSFPFQAACVASIAKKCQLGPELLCSPYPPGSAGSPCSCLSVNERVLILFTCYPNIVAMLPNFASFH